jgi:hypothetical protein
MKLIKHCYVSQEAYLYCNILCVDHNIISAEQDVLQPKRKDILPLKVPENSAKNISVDKILKEKLLEERKLRELQNEAEAYQPTEDKVGTRHGCLRQCCILLYLSVKLCNVIPDHANNLKSHQSTCCDF